MIFNGGGQAFLKLPKQQVCNVFTILKKEVIDEVNFLHADKHQSFLQVDFNTLGIKFSYKVILSLLMGMVKHSQSTQSNKSFIMSQLLLYLVIPCILMYSCDHIICSGLSILFLYAPAHKAYIFEKFVFELEAF